MFFKDLTEAEKQALVNKAIQEAVEHEDIYISSLIESQIPNKEKQLYQIDQKLKSYYRKRSDLLRKERLGTITESEKNWLIQIETIIDVLELEERNLLEPTGLDLMDERLTEIEIELAEIDKKLEKLESK